MPLCPEGTTAPAIRLFQQRERGEFADFQVGIRKYDSRAENNHRWVNLKVEAFGDLCERIKKMSLQEGSFIPCAATTTRSAGRTRIPARGVVPVIVLMTSSLSPPADRRRNRTATARIRGGQGQQGYSQAPGAPLGRTCGPAQSGQTMQAPTEMPQNSRGMRASAGDRTPSSRAEELKQQ